MVRFKGRNVAGVLLALASFASPAGAAVIYSNGGPNTTNGYSIEGTTWTADDFTLGGNATILSVGFYYQNYNGISGWAQNVSYEVIQDAAGPFGAVAGSGAGQNVTAADSGLPWCCGGGNAYLVTFDLQSPVNVTGGTQYWLKLTGATTTLGHSWWVTADPNSTATGISGGSSTGQQFAFFLNDTASGPVAIPEPGSAILAGFGGLGLFILRRRLHAR